MTFSYRSLLGVADSLATSNEERYSRSAVNRAYYAVYGEARELARRHGWSHNKRRGGSHQQVWNFLRSGAGLQVRHQQAAMKSIADAGLALRDKRTKADYHAGEVSPSEAADVLARARVLVNRIINAP